MHAVGTVKQTLSHVCFKVVQYMYVVWVHSTSAEISILWYISLAKKRLLFSLIRIVKNLFCQNLFQLQDLLVSYKIFFLHYLVESLEY